MCAIKISALDCTAHILGSTLPLYFRDQQPKRDTWEQEIWQSKHATHEILNDKRPHYDDALPSGPRDTSPSYGVTNLGGAHLYFIVVGIAYDCFYILMCKSSYCHQSTKKGEIVRAFVSLRCFGDWWQCFCGLIVCTECFQRFILLARDDSLPSELEAKTV